MQSYKHNLSRNSLSKDLIIQTDKNCPNEDLNEHSRLKINTNKPSHNVIAKTIFNFHQKNCKNSQCKHNHKFDQLGMLGSFICAIHCIITPFVISVLLALKANGIIFQGWESLNLVFFIMAPILGFLGFKSAYKKHLSFIPSGTFTIGLIILAIGLFVPIHHNLEHLLSSFGGFIMAGAHLMNLKLIQS